jgi:hypothetical protein
MRVYLDIGSDGTTFINENQAPGGIPLPISTTPAFFPEGDLDRASERDGVLT